jgi:protein-disulfide isomerase
MVAAFLTHSYGSGMGKPGGRQWPFVAYMAILSAAAIAGTGYGYSLRGEVPGANTVKQDVPAYDESDVFMGSADAPVVVTEFTDLYCPTCRSQHAWFMSKVGPLIEAGKVRLVMRHFPLPETHPLAIKAAMFAIWAQKEGQFWEFMGAVHQIMDNKDEAALLAAVEAVGLDPSQANAVLSDTSTRAALQKDMDDAAKLHVDSTPTWVVDYPDGTRQFTIASGIRRLVDDVYFKKFTQ